MKFTVDRKAFSDAFLSVAAFAPTRSPKEILCNVVVIATESGLSIRATDMVISFTMTVNENVDVESGGAALLPVQRTSSILRENTDERLTIWEDDGSIRIHGEHCNYRLASANPDEYPQPQGFDDDKYHVVASGEFRTALSRTHRYADAESSRYALGAVLLEMDGDRVTTVGTDGRRLGTMEITGRSVGGHATSGTSTLLPVRAAALLERVLGTDSSDVFLAAHPSEIAILMEKGEMRARLVEGRYPNWQQVIPKFTDTKSCVIPAGVLASATRQAAITTDQESRGIAFTFDAGELVLESDTADIGSSKVRTPLEYDGGNVTLTLDNRYVTDLCRAIDSEEMLAVEFDTGSQPIIFRTIDNYTCVIMPMAR
jgi:DNA polymerase-3 subunit beta